MNIKVQWVFGNFLVTAATTVETAEPVGKLMGALAHKGFLQLLQRVPASNAEKALAGYDKRPAGFKRDSIPYTEDNALALAEAFGTSVEVEPADKEKGIAAVVLPFSITDVQEHVGSEGGASRKMATEMAERLTAPMYVALGIAEDADEATKIEACHRFLAALRAKPTKK